MKTNEEITAYLARKKQALNDPDHHGRFWTELQAGAALNFNINADHDAEIRIVIDCGGVTIFVNMMIEEARSVHEKFGKAIAEMAEEIEHLRG